MNQLAIIIPVAPSERAWINLLSDLKDLPREIEVILVGTGLSSKALESFLKKTNFKPQIRWLTSKPGRAIQMNSGAQESSRKLLWFLHADSRINQHAIKALLMNIERDREAFYYFDLKFDNDGPLLTHLNAVGAWIRSHVMKLPFGDQGFLIKRDLFHALGGFPEDVAYGEDHRLVWKARQRGVPILSTGAFITTSARKYKSHGWLKTTIRHGVLTLRQAWPEWRRLLGQEKVT